ncbi:MAG: hypothetical protein ACE5JI_14860 [Acidobacteriota bacterium]
MGFERVVELWESMGMASRIQPYPSLVLGAFETTPLELATAYAAIANGGTSIDPLTGKLAGALCPRARREVFITGTEPRELCRRH